MDKTANHQAPCCQHCGNELVGETTGGLCPRCLLAMNMASRTMPDGETVPQPPPPTAEEIAGHFPQFEILEYLGRGGMGIVYKARQKVLDRLVAIKVLAGERRDDPQFEVRFSREARTLAKLNHPNIVTVHDFGESGGMFYLVMEYVDGVNLRDVLRDGQMEPAQALVIVPAICEALQYAHEHDVVHRDIKPENILLDREGRVKIADFGIATLVGATAERSGTPPYMAPEQEAADGKVDHRADIYALGVVFYEMLTGERPAKDLIAPSKKVQLDVRIDEIVLHALEQEPERRYQTAGEFGTVVGTMASHPPTPYVVPAAVPAPSQPVTPSHGRWQPIVAALLLIGSMLAWGILGYLNYVLPRLAEQFAARDIELPTATRWIFQLGGFLSHFGILLVPLLMLVTGGALVWLFLSVTSPRADSVLTLEQQKARVWPVRKAWGLGVASLCFVFGALINGEQALRVSISGAEGSHAWLVFVNLAAAVGFGVASFRYARASRGRPSTQRAGVALPVLAGITILGLVLTALLFWVQRPRPWDGSALSGESYDQMFVAGGRTWYAKRIFGDDCTFYRFEVHGRGGSVVERWDVKVPFKKLATNSARPPRHKISFANNGGVFWSEDSKRVSFRVNGVEVAGFDTDTGKPTRPEGEGETPEEVLRDYTEAGFNGDIRQALSMIGPPLSETREEVANALLRLRVREEDKAQPLELAEWHKEGDYALARYENPPEMRAHQMPHKPYVILERSGTTWKVVWAAVSRIENSPADNLRAFRRFQRVNCEDRKEVARAFIGAIARGDTATAFMFCAQPMGGSPSEFFRKFSKATQGSGPLKWHEDGPYAVTHAAFLADQPEVETAVILKQAGEIWRVVWANGSSPTATLADDLKRFKQEKMVSRVMVEDLALQFLVAIREQDEKALRELCVDRTEGWTAALVGQFAMELREMFHKKTGAEFTMYPDSIRVEKDLAVVTCRAFREVQKFLGGNILVLYFCRTGEGWKVWTARKAPASQSLDEHLEQARKWAAEWDHPETGNAVETTPATPEHVARAFMQAIQFGNIDAAMHWAAPEMKARKNPRRNFEGLAAELKKAYAGKLALLTEFTEWYPQNRDEDTRFVGTRIAGVPADDGTERLHSLYLILSPTADGWKVAHLDDAYSDKPLSHYVDRIERIIPGEGPLIRDEAAERPADSAVGVPGTGGAIEVGQGESVVRSVNLPDADTADVPKVLDLASGELLGVPVEGQRDIIKHFNKLGKGDLAWDNGLSTFRGAKVHEWHNGVWELVVPDRESEGCASYRRLKLPKRLLVTTAEGDSYRMEFRAGAGDGVVVVYHGGTATPEPQLPGGSPSLPRGATPVERAKGLPVTPPHTMPEDSALTVEQLKTVLEGVTWDEFITVFADDGHGQEVSWKEVAADGGKGARFEVGFSLGDEKMLLDLEVDPEFRQATPLRLRSAENPGEVVADPAEFMPQMVTCYAVKSNHPAAAPAIAKLRERALQTKDMSTLRIYALAITTYQADHGTLPPNLQALVDGKFLRELMLMENHEAGKKEMPLYHGGPDLQVGKLEGSKVILLAAPAADKAGKRIVGFLDQSVKAIDEADYQKLVRKVEKTSVIPAIPTGPAVPPVVIRTVPESGVKEVDPALNELRVTFSKPMQDGSWSWCRLDDETFPEMAGEPRYLDDLRTCVLPVKLQPGRTYATWINVDQFQGFRDQSGQPAVPYLLIFATRK